MYVYSFNLNECKNILARNFCLTNISSDILVTLSIDSNLYQVYKNADNYIAGVYITLDTIDIINNTAAIYIAECPRGYKSVNSNCVEILYTPLGEFTLGELYFYGIIAIPISLFLINKSEGIIKYLFPGDKK